MNKIRLRFLIFLLPVMAMLLVSIASGQSADQPAAQPAGDAKAGSELYLKNGCWECHGYSGANGPGAPLVLTTLNATGFMNYIRNPRTNNMPLYSAKVISDKDAANLFAYIKTFKKPPEVKDVPLLQQLLNEK